MMDITQISGVGGDSEMTYRNIIAFTTKKYKNAILIWGIPLCCGTNALGYSSRNMRLYHNKSVFLAEPQACWAHIEDCSLNIYRREKCCEQKLLGRMKHIPRQCYGVRDN